MHQRKLPQLELRGTPMQRGEQHGRALASQIRETIRLYAFLLKLPKRRLFRLASHFRQVITKFCPAYAQEIEGIAKGARVDVRWLFALNARTELIDFAVGECTAAMIPSGGLLAQNWDWYQKMADLTAIVRIEREDGHRVLMLVEPGQIGKIGINSAGIGVCLNFLLAPQIRLGVPATVLMRAILDCRSMDEVRALLSRTDEGRSVNLLIGHESGDAIMMEFWSEGRFELSPVGYQGDVYLHTNHYLACDEKLWDEESMQDSLGRYARAMELSRDDSTPRARVERILLDAADFRYPICAPASLYPEQADTPLGPVYTAFTLIMDLAKRTMAVRQPPRGGFTVYRCEER